MEKVFEVRSEINKNNINEAVKILGKIKISNENEEEQINLLFGDIYLKINQPTKAEEFYEKSFMTTNENIESLTFIGLAEVKLAQGNLREAIEYSEKSIFINSDRIRPKLILATAKFRIGDINDANEILQGLYDSNKDNAQVNLAISDYYVSINQVPKSILILEEYLKFNPTNFKIMDQIGNLYWLNQNKEEALEYKFKVFKYYQKIRNRKKTKEVKNWIESIEPDYFIKKSKKTRLSKKTEKIEESEKEKEDQKS
jgi:tetratricopeptide (TPR) repeat protein